MLLNGIMAFEPLVTSGLPVYTAHGRSQYTQMLLPWALYRASGDSSAFKMRTRQIYKDNFLPPQSKGQTGMVLRSELGIKVNGHGEIQIYSSKTHD